MVGNFPKYLGGGRQVLASVDEAPFLKRAEPSRSSEQVGRKGWAWRKQNWPNTKMHGHAGKALVR
jgi:hypothetical protein